MCMVSKIMDKYHVRWQNPLPVPITSAEIAEFRDLLEKARRFDRDTNQPDCGSDKKKQALLKMAEALGIDISFINDDD